MRTLVLSVEDHVNYLDGRWVGLSFHPTTSITVVPVLERLLAGSPLCRRCFRTIVPLWHSPNRASSIDVMCTMLASDSREVLLVQQTPIVDPNPSFCRDHTNTWQLGCKNGI